MRWLWVACLIAACGENAGAPGHSDLSVTPPDLAAGASGDMTAPSSCATVDPKGDGQPCGTGCPAGTVEVTQNNTCNCWYACDPAQPTECPCDRTCAPLTRGDAGVVGGACLVENGPGERCGESGVSGPSSLNCAQNLLCVNADPAGTFRYCVYDCTAGGDSFCPIQTACLMLTGSSTKACAYDSTSSGIAAGMACQPNQSCVTGYLCDGVCRPQCDRAGATCASGTCQPLSDGTRVVGYVCK